MMVLGLVLVSLGQKAIRNGHGGNGRGKKENNFIV